MPKTYPTEKLIQDKILTLLYEFEEYSDYPSDYSLRKSEASDRRFAQRMINTLAPMFNQLEKEICGLCPGRIAKPNCTGRTVCIRGDK
jgi:hypothetical protein